MLSKKELTLFEQILMNKRHEVFERSSRLSESWRKLQEPEVEFEEAAQKDRLSQNVDLLDERSRNVIQAIDAALDRIQKGTYGYCLSCEEPIASERLKAIPWAIQCTDCAERNEHQVSVLPVSAPSHASNLPSDLVGSSDEELKQAIYEELKVDGRLDLKELHIYCHHGVVHLEGFLPSEETYQILIEIIQDTMGFKDVVDKINIERQLWERADRTPPKVSRRRDDRKKTKAEVLLQGEDINENVYKSRKTGEPLSPPDQLVPEKEGK
jgi:DnaK suppressor protein